MTNLEALSEWYGTRELDFDRTLLKLRYRTIKEFFKGETCLEIAPAQGLMTAFLKDDFKTLHVVEGSKNLLNQIPDYPNLTKFHSMVEDFVPPHAYDFVVMDHILEHVDDSMVVLNVVKAYLKKGATLVVGVPNARSFHRLAAVKMGYLN